MANRKAKPIRVYEFNQTSFNNNGICTLFPKSAVITRDLNEYKYYLDLTHPIDETGKWKEITQDRIIVANEQPFRIKFVQKTSREIVAYCEQIFFDLNNNFIEDTNIKGKNGNTALNQILSNTNYAHPFSGTSNIQIINKSRLVRKNVLSAIIGDNENSFVNRWGGELDIDGFTFKINTRIGRNNGYKVEYSKNMTGINAKFDMRNVVTKIRPVGFDGIKLEELFVDSPLINSYAMPIIREYKYEDVKWKGSPNYQAPLDGEADGAYETLAEAQAELKRRALAEFSENKVDLPTVNYNVNFVELSNTDEYANYQALSSINIGDDVVIRHKILDINIPARCTAYKYNCLTCNFDEITLGHYNKNFFTDVKNTMNDVDSVKDTLQELPSQLNDILQQSKEYVTDFINGGFGGYVYYTPNAIYILDNPDVNVAKNVAVFNMNGLGFSNNGINGTFETAITRDGHIVADFIDTGILTADIIKTGILESKNGKSWLDMSTGDFNFGDKVKYENGKFEIIVESSDGGNINLGDELSNMNNKIDSITHAPTVELTGEQAFLYENNFTGTPTPSTIKISARVENVESPTYEWYFKRSDETSWTPIANNNYNYYNVSHNDSEIFNNSNVKNVTFKCSVGDVYDEFTIVKVSSGSNGTIGNDGIGITEIQEQYYLSGSQQILIGGTWQTTAPTWVKGKYIWTRTQFTYSDGNVTTTSPICVTGKDGADGLNGGVSVENVDVLYYQSTSATSLQDGSWTTTAPTWENGKYVWSKTITYLSNDTQIESNPVCITGERGQNGIDGINGTNGEDGISTYFFIRYSEFSDGSSMTSTPNAKTKYMGTATTTNNVAPTTPSSYTWTLVKGADGKDGEQGVAGANGSSSYLHIKYSNDGETFTANNGEELGTWIGTYVDTNPTDSSVFSDYNWVRFVGEDGADAYTVLLSNENHTFPSTYEGNIENAITITTVAIAYKGKTSITPTIGTLPTVTGLSLSKSGNAVTIVVNKGMSLADTGTFKIPVIVDGITFEKTFSWSKSKNGLSGADGEDGYTVFLTNENFTFVADDTGNVTKAQTTTTSILAYKGSNSLAFTIGTLPTVNGLTLSKTTDTITIKANTGASLADVGSFDIIINADGKSFTKTFSWSKSKQGATGATGASGTNAKSVDIMASTQVFKSTDGGTTFLPNSIVLTAVLQNVTYSGWQCSTDGGKTWNELSSSTPGWSVSNGVLTINNNFGLFTSTNTTVVFRVNTNDSKIYDTITLVKLYDVTDIEIGGRNYIRNGKGNMKDGFFKNFNDVTGTYGELTLTSQKTYSHISITDGFVLGCRDYEVGRKMVFSYDIMYTKWDFPSGADRKEFWIGQRYTNTSDNSEANGKWRDVTSHSLPIVGENGCKLNEWYHVSKVITIPEQADASVNTEASIKFYNSNANVSASFTARFKNVKLEYGTIETDWTPSPEDVDYDINTAINPLIKTDEQLTKRLDNAFSDDVITAYEKIQIASDLKEIDAQYDDVTKTVKSYNDSSITGIYNEYKVAYNNLHTVLDPCLENMDTDTELSNSVVKDAFLLYGTYYSHLRSAIDDYIKNSFDTTKSSITSLSNSVDIAISKSSSNEQNLNTIAKHMKFSDEGWLELFATTNGNEGRFKTKITDTKLSFTDNNQEVAYMSNQKLYINYAQINNDLQIGSIVATKSDKGGIVFKWQ